MALPETLMRRFFEASREDFEQVVHAHLKPLIRHLQRAKRLGTVDQWGADLYTLRNAGELDDGYQCKGFELGFGEHQLGQCIHSIATFKRKLRENHPALPASSYTLIVNRPVVGDYRTELQHALADLIASGVVKETALVSYAELDPFLSRLTAVWLRSAFGSRISELRTLMPEADPAYYVASVPCALKGMALERGPLTELLSLNDDVVHRPEICLVSSEFGFGKSTLLLKLADTLVGRGQIVGFGRATELDAQALGGADVLLEAVIAPLLEDEAVNPYKEEFSLLARSVLANELANGRATLILDGVDEAPIAYEANGLVSLLRCTKQTGGFNVLATRLEFWFDRGGDVERAIEGLGLDESSMGILALNPWTDAHVDDYVCGMLTQPEHTDSPSLQAFQTELENRAVRDRYGDLLYRPLFLAMLVQDVIQGVVPFNAAQLLERYFRRKLTRDNPPAQLGPYAGRQLPFANEDQHARTGRLLEVLSAIARASLIIKEEKDGPIMSVREEFLEDELYKISDEFGCSPSETHRLILNSMLVPISPRTERGIRYRFANKCYHEWFAARGLLGRSVGNALLPPNVAKFLTEMEADRRQLVTPPAR